MRWAEGRTSSRSLGSSSPSTTPSQVTCAPRIVAFVQQHGDGAAAGDHDGPIGEGMRADGNHHQHIEAGIDDGATTGQRIGCGAGGAGNYQSVAAMRVDVAVVHAGFKIQDAAGFPLGEHHVVERQLAAFAAIGGDDAASSRGR